MTDDGVKRMHAPIVEQDHDGTWFAYCHACSHTAGNYVIECREPTGKPWPPFQLQALDYPPAITAQYLAQLTEQYTPGSTPETLRADLIGFIESAISNRPRSQQRRIGPSEIGHECGRWLAYKLADVEPVNPVASLPSWRTQIGTAVHTWLAEMLGETNASLAGDRFLIEQRVDVASLVMPDGTSEEVTGSGDVYDAQTATVVDWKIVGPSTLKKVRAVSRETKVPHGASERYRIQGMIYGRGYRRRGLPVDHVMIAFLPAAGDLTDGYFHTEPYDDALAEKYVSRMTGTRSLLNAMSLGDVAKLAPTADVFCTRCPYFAPEADTLDAGCPGHSGRKVRQDSLLSLLPPDDRGTAIPAADRISDPFARLPVPDDAPF